MCIDRGKGKPYNLFGMKQNRQSLPGGRLFLAVSYVIWAAVALRWIGEFIEQGHPRTGLLSVMLAVYAILLGLEPFIARGPVWRAHAYLLFQTALVFLASLLYYELDFFALLYLPLAGQAMLALSRRPAFTWVGILIAFTFVGQAIQFGGWAGVPFSLLYVAGLLFIAAFSQLMIQADTSRREAEKLLAELHEAHRQLQVYAGQAEELATARERNRLARELHDSVAQTLYGLTLQSEAASRKLSDGELGTVADRLIEIRQGALQSLQETRLLIYELRPPILEEVGLVAALRGRLDAVEARSGLSVHFDAGGIDKLPESLEMGLYGIAREALNNVLKHARASQVRVGLTQEGGKILLEVADDGVGFEPAARGVGSGLGLQSMLERAEQIGGKLEIQSAPGNGVSVRVQVPL